MTGAADRDVPARPRLAAAAFAGACLCACLAGCSGSLFQSKTPAPAVYLLAANLAPPTAAADAAAAAPADLAVQRPTVRAGLNTDRIALLYPDRRLDYFAGGRWSGAVDEVVRDLAVQAFATGANLRNVSADSSAFASGYWLEIEVADFQAEYVSPGLAPTIHVHLVARVGSAVDRHVLGTVDASARKTASDNRLTAIVDAYERAAAAVLAEIVSGTSRTLAENSGHR